MKHAKDKIHITDKKGNNIMAECPHKCLSGIDVVTCLHRYHLANRPGKIIRSHFDLCVSCHVGSMNSSKYYGAFKIIQSSYEKPEKFKNCDSCLVKKPATLGHFPRRGTKYLSAVCWECTDISLLDNSAAVNEYIGKDSTEIKKDEPIRVEDDTAVSEEIIQESPILDQNSIEIVDEESRKDTPDVKPGNRVDEKWDRIESILKAVNVPDDIIASHKVFYVHGFEDGSQKSSGCSGKCGGHEHK